MLEVTEEALQYLLRSLRGRKAPDHVAMRMTRRSGVLEIAPDQEDGGDQGFDVEDRTVLLVNQALAREMDGQRLCVAENSDGLAELCIVPS